MKLFLPLALALNGFRSSSALGDLSQLGHAIEMDTASANRHTQLPLGEAMRTLKENEATPLSDNVNHQRQLQNIDVACPFEGQANKALLLMADTSISVNSEEFDFSKNGIAAAFFNSEVKQRIADYGPIAVSLVYWSGPDLQYVAVPWSLLNSATDSEEFGNEVLQTSPPPERGNTALGSAMQWALDDYTSGMAAFDGCGNMKRIIDFSGDGADNTSPGGDGLVRRMSRQAYRNDIQINALPIFSSQFPDLRQYFLDNVVTLGGFAEPTVLITQVDQGFINKITKEVGNQEPIANDLTNVLVQQNTTTIIDVLVNDTDADGDPLSILEISQGPVKGTAEIVDNKVVYYPNENECRGDIFVYVIGDGRGGMDTASVTININCAPIAQNTMFNVNENEFAILDVVGNATDPDGDDSKLRVDPTRLGKPFYGTAGVNAQGQIVYRPNQDFIGVDAFEYTIIDELGGTDTATVLLVVNNVNQDPVANNDFASTPEDTPVVINVLANDTDPDIRTSSQDITSLTVSIPTTLSPFDDSLKNGPFYGTAIVTPGIDNIDRITYIPDPNFHGTEIFAYQITDPEGAKAFALVMVEVVSVNDEPIARDDSAHTMEDTPVLVDILINDEDPDGDNVTVTLLRQPFFGTAVVQLNNTLLYTPNKNFNGVDSVDYRIQDPDGAMDSATVTILVLPVNDGPIAANLTETTREKEPVTINVLKHAKDPEFPREVLTVSIPRGQEITKNGGTLKVNMDETITYTPKGYFNGEDMFYYVVTDLDGLQSSAWVIVTVTPVNDPPIAVDDGAITEEDTSVTIDVLANDDDPDFPFGDGDMLNVTITEEMEPMFGTVVVNDDWTVTYTPNADYNGADRFSYMVTDLGGLTDTAQVAVIITPVNDAPVAQDLPLRFTDEDTPVNIEILPFVVDRDLSYGDGDELFISVPGWQYGPFNGTVEVLPDQTVTYTPNLNFNGNDTFVYVVTDKAGAQDNATVRLYVRPVNDQPYAENDFASTPEDTPVTVNPLVNDYDPDLFDTNPLAPQEMLTVSLGTVGPFHGNVRLNPDNTITYFPNNDYNGPDLFFYNITDIGNLNSSAVIAILVTPVNEAPIAQDDMFVTLQNTAKSLDVLANDIDPDFPPDTLSITVEMGPFFGSYRILPNNTVLYTPDPDFLGTDRFAYTITDPAGLSSTAVAIVEVILGNQAPTAFDDYASTDQGTPVKIYVLANDRDFENSQLTVNIATSPTSGSVVVNSDNTVTYTPRLGFSGRDVFRYTVRDPEGVSDSATVTVTVLDKCENQQKCPAWTDRVYWGSTRRRLGQRSLFTQDLYPACIHNKHDDSVETVCATLEDISSSFKHDPNVEFLACGCCAAEPKPPLFCH